MTVARRREGPWRRMGENDPAFEVEGPTPRDRQERDHGKQPLRMSCAGYNHGAASRYADQQHPSALPSITWLHGIRSHDGFGAWTFSRSRSSTPPLFRFRRSTTSWSC